MTAAFVYDGDSYTMEDLRLLVGAQIDIPYTDPKDARQMVHEYYTVREVYYEASKSSRFTMPVHRYFAKMTTESGGDTVISMYDLFSRARVVLSGKARVALNINKSVHWSDLVRQLWTYDSGFQYYGIE